jgi:hypothetical protein
MKRLLKETDLNSTYVFLNERKTFSFHIKMKILKLICKDVSDKIYRKIRNKIYTRSDNTFIRIKNSLITHVTILK